MKKILRSFLLLLVSFVFLTSCTGRLEQTNSSDVLPTISLSPSETQPTAVLPDFVYDLQNDINTDYLSRINVQIPGKLRYSDSEAKYIQRSFDYDGGEVVVNLILENGMKGSTPMGVVILCDGLPVPYTADGLWEGKVF